MNVRSYHRKLREFATWILEQQAKSNYEDADIAELAAELDVAADAWMDSHRCTCCGDLPGACACDIRVVEEEDPSVGYRANINFCFTHDHRAD